MRKILSFIIFTLLFTTNVSAAVWINEISPSTNPEWIELFNDSNDVVDLSNWKIEDGNNNFSDDLTLSGSIAGNSYLVFSHNDGWLNNSGDLVKLYNAASPSAAIVDQYSYGNVSADKVVARVPSGSENWSVSTPSQGAANPTPTPSPSPSPSPSPTPQPSPSPTPTPTPTPIASSKPSLKPSPSVLPSPEQLATVAGVTTEIDLSAFGVSPSPESSLSGDSRKAPELNKSRAKTALLVGSGLLLLSLAGYLGYRKYQNSTIISE